MEPAEITFFILILVTLVIITITIYYFNQNIQCQSHPQFICFTDWICDYGTGGQKDTPYPSTVKPIDMVSCVLKSMYGSLVAADIAAGGKCVGFSNRGTDACNKDSICTEDGSVNTKFDNTSLSTTQCACNFGAGTNTPSTSATGTNANGTKCSRSNCESASFNACFNQKTVECS